MPAHNVSSKVKARNSSSVFWQLGQTAGKHMALCEAGFFQQKLGPKYIFLQTDLFLEDNLKSNLLFRKICSMFPFKGAHLLCDWHVLCKKFHCHEAVKIWKIKESINTHKLLLSTSGATSLCISNLWHFSNWLTYSKILLRYVVFLETFHCCGFFLPSLLLYGPFMCSLWLSLVH